MTQEEYLLILIAEEASEVAKAASKVARFGPRRCGPDALFTNQELVFRELFDLIAVIEMTCEAGYMTDFRGGPGETAIKEQKKAKVIRLMDLSRELGRLT